MGTPTESLARGEVSADQLLDAAPDAMIVVGGDGRIMRVNIQGERLFGYTRTELIGRDLELLIPERFRKTHATHVGTFFSAPVTRPMGSGLALFGRHKNGSELPIEVSLSPVTSSQGMSVVAAIRDISERKRMEAAAKLSADRLAGAVESIQDCIALFDADDRLVLCNSAYRFLMAEAVSGPIIGRSYQVLLDAWLGTLAFSDASERERFRAERLSNRKDPKGSVDVRTLDGRSLRVTDRRTADGGIVKTVSDLTADIRLAEELRHARLAAEAGSNAKTEFLSSMSHELRTPLNAILGFAQLLQRDKKDPLSERNQQRVGQILKGGEHLLRLIDDILDLARIEAGRVSVSAEPLNVADVLDTVRTTLDSMATRSGIRLHMVPVDPAVPRVIGDRTRFAQILMNFGSNAIKYNRPAGSVTFRVTMPRPAMVRVTVEDTGVGIAAENQDKLFQPFQRAGQETGPIEGTGIGLVITKRLAELMKGTVGFASKEGEGSSFWLEVPAHVAPPPSISTSADTRASLHLDGEVEKTVLYVEDNPANVVFMEDLLGGFDNIRLVTAPTAEMGIELAQIKRPAVIIMDINLPGMSGLEALRTLRALPETTTIPIIALTAAASDRDRKRGLEEGFYCYLTKPVKVADLEAALQGLLNAGD